MSEIAVSEELSKVLRNLAAHPDGMRVSSALAVLDDRSHAHELDVRFALSFCQQAGWILHDEDNDMWRLSDDGRDALRACNPLLLLPTAKRCIERISANSFRFFQSNDTERTASVAFDSAKTRAFDEVADYVNALPCPDFKRLVSALFEAMGYRVRAVGIPVPDGGIDFVATRDLPRESRAVTKIRVSHQRLPATLGEVKGFVETIFQGESGSFVCSGGFSREAAWHPLLSPSRLSLIDLGEFLRLWTHFLHKTLSDTKLQLPLAPIWCLRPTLR